MVWSEVVRALDAVTSGRPDGKGLDIRLKLRVRVCSPLPLATQHLCRDWTRMAS